MVYVRRDVENELEKWIDDKEIMLLRGPRQSGKTTLLLRLKEMLDARGVGDERIRYVSFEDDSERLKFEADCKEFVSLHLTAEKTYFLFDEVQYVRDIGKKLKLLFDSFPQAKFVATGSSSFDLTNAGSFLVGRAVFIDVFPFNFGEFLRAKDAALERKYSEVRFSWDRFGLPEKTVYLADLNRLLHEYLTYGSYPRVVLEPDFGKKRELLKNLFTAYVEKDVVVLYGNKYRDGAVKLLKSLAGMLGSTVNFETLAQSSGLKYNDVRKLLPLLQDSFVVRVVRPFHRSLASELRKNPKVFFFDAGLRNHLLERFDNISFDGLYENFVCNSLAQEGAVKYWRTTAKTEVDFVLERAGGLVPVEVKTAAKVTRALASFASEYGVKYAVLANLDVLEKRELPGCTVLLLPFAYF
ncbi:MAG: ATP-binding protein [Candidatus Micrarchaeota archaeon]